MRTIAIACASALIGGAVAAYAVGVASATPDVNRTGGSSAAAHAENLVRDNYYDYTSSMQSKTGRSILEETTPLFGGTSGCDYLYQLAESMVDIGESAAAAGMPYQSPWGADAGAMEAAANSLSEARYRTAAMAGCNDAAADFRGPERSRPAAPPPAYEESAAGHQSGVREAYDVCMQSEFPAAGGDFLRRGDGSIGGTDPQSQMIRSAQKSLDLLGYGGSAPIAADGSLGSITQAALRSFQQDMGLYVDGVLGPRTWSMLHDHVTRYGMCSGVQDR